MMKKALLVLSALLLVAGTTWAASPQTDAMDVSALLEANCTITAGDLVFGSYNVINESADTADIDLQCTFSSPWTLTIVGTREMTGADPLNVDVLPFEIHTVATHDNEFVSVIGVGNGAVQTTTAYGVVRTGYFVTPDTYGTQLQATVTF